MKRPPRIMLSAGEASGDRLGAGLARALRQRVPALELFGMGGGEMARAGVEIVQDANEVAVVGFLEVLSHLPALRRAKRRLGEALERRKPDLLVPIDFPDFNFVLAHGARRRGVPVVYFVSPQVWAWRRGRVRTIRRLVRRILVLFPFEVDFYRDAGVPVTFVGHPVAERGIASVSTEALGRQLGLDPRSTTVALLPGSRRSEVQRLLPVMLAAAARLREKRPALQFLIPLAPGLPREVVTTHAERSGLAGLHIHEGDFPDVLRLCAAGVVASGTASLEAATVGLPIVVVYRVGTVSYWISRALVRVDHVALPNLVAERRIVPELIQSECTAETIAEHVEQYLDRPDRVERARRELAEVRRRLGDRGVFDRAADAVVDELSSIRSAQHGEDVGA